MRHVIILMTILAILGIGISCKPTKRVLYPPSTEDVIQDSYDGETESDTGQYDTGQSDTGMNGEDIVQDIADLQGLNDTAGDVSDLDTDFGEGIPVIQCVHDEDCADFIKYGDGQCAAPVCGTQGVCSFKDINNGAACDPKNICVLSAVCDNGKCKGADKDCDDNNPCTTDFCDPEQGCLHKANNAPCNDGNACTTLDLCEDGQCNGHNNQCECATNDDCLKIDDKNKCNGILECDNGSCVIKPGSIVECPVATESCMMNVCQPDTGECLPVPVKDGVLCEDETICSSMDECISGKCVGVKFLDCDDDNECTSDSCDPVKGCSHKDLIGNSCDDGNGCTTGDTCTEQGCKGEHIPGCGCTKPEDCKALFLHNGGNLCQSTLACVANQCKAIPIDKPKECPPSDNPCLSNECEPSTGECVHLMVPDGRVCSDDDPCTINDICQNGNCVSEPKVCDSPPTDQCVGADSLQTWGKDGLCNQTSGECEYPSNTKICDYACIENTCVSSVEMLQAQSIPMGPATMSGREFHLKCASGWFESGIATGSGFSLIFGYSAN